MRTTCDMCDAAWAFYVVERRSQADLYEHWLCEQHARDFLEHAPLSYWTPEKPPYFDSPHECIAHSVAIVAIPLADLPCAVYLDRLDGNGTTVCIVGQVEARGIAQGLAASRDLGASTRPSTHGEMNTIISALGGRVASVVVDDFDIAEHRFHAQLYIESKNGREPTLVGIRPSDAIALALVCDAPIYILSSVITTYESERRRMTPMGND